MVDLTASLSQIETKQGSGGRGVYPSRCRRTAEPITLDELRNSGPLDHDRVTIRAHARDHLDLRVLVRGRWLHEAAHRVPGPRAPRHDSLHSRDGPFVIECASAGVPLDRTNLIWRAAETLWRSLRRSGPVRDVRRAAREQIPLQAGLGGGSADGGGALLALGMRGVCRSSRRQLTDLAPTSGRVPFFLSGGTALGSGAVRRSIRWRTCRATGIVLLIPGFGVSTTRPTAVRLGTGALACARGRRSTSGAVAVASAQMINDLEAPIARHSSRRSTR